MIRFQRPIISTYLFPRVSVVGEGGACPEVGPFFPPTPLYMVQNGLALSTDILLEPDWVMIAVLIVVSLAIIVILIIALLLFKKYGWTKVMFLVPYYRALAKKFSFDDYSSKVSFAVGVNWIVECN